MNDNKLIDRYKELRNRIILNQKKKNLNKTNNNYLNLLYDNTAIYKEFINENTSVVVGGSIKHAYTFKTRDLDEAYINLIEKIGNKSATNIKTEEELISILNAIYQTVIEYFGYGDVKNRISYYEQNNNVTLEKLKGKNLAVCLEDAVLSQNILKLLGFDSTLKVSLIQHENKEYDTHAYNLIKFQDKNYIFDSRFPSKTSPIVSILTEEEYLNFTSNLNENIQITNTDNKISYFSNNIPLKEAKKRI